MKFVYFKSRSNRRRSRSRSRGRRKKKKEERRRRKKKEEEGGRGRRKRRRKYGEVYSTDKKLANEIIIQDSAKNCSVLINRTENIFIMILWSS